ncbi:MAG TPA: hypothetical protein VGB98_24740 [Pyrinomonadaceae bacterium]|jgi:hypothetical protein
MTAAAADTYQPNPTNDPAFANIPVASGLYTGFTGFRTHDGDTVTYTREILFRGTYVLAIAGAQINFGGLRPGYDLYGRETPQDGYFTRLSHGEHMRDAAVRCAETMDDHRRAERVTVEQLPAVLMWLGHRYERAALAEPRAYRTMDRASAVLDSLQRRFEEADCGMFFRRGQNAVRRLRGLEGVAAW